MQTIEDFMYEAHKHGIHREVLENIEIVKRTTKFQTAVAAVEAAYHLTIKEMEIYTVESREWKSSLVNKTEYTPDTMELIIEFNNGKKYLYKNFSEEQYQAFCSAESQGKYFLSEIRKKYKDTEDVIKLETDEQSTGS
jgi:Na+-translocating ferredoxin:NAD+ oxidoreductase RnfC subunit